MVARRVFPACLGELPEHAVDELTFVLFEGGQREDALDGDEGALDDRLLRVTVSEH